MIARATPISILYDEHEAILDVLGYLQRAVSALERGEDVPVGIFEDMSLFFTVFVGQCHHGKEERLLFPRLEHTPDLAAAISRLEHGHAQGEELGAAYAAAVTGYAERGRQAAAPLIAAAKDYSAFLHEHISGEDDTLARAQAQLGAVPSAEDELVAAFERFEEEVMGRGTHDRLHEMIKTLGPRLERFGPAFSNEVL
jgi:hemerythrin-like domain-containing protein